MKLIHEGRMGTHKCFKTGAILGTYPKPMLALMFDEAGADVIPAKGRESGDINAVKLDLCAEEVVTILPEERAPWLSKPREQQPKLLVINFAVNRPGLDLLYKPQPSSTQMQAAVDTINDLLRLKPFPWRTAVMDSSTTLQDVILAHLASVNKDSLNDARQWAAMVGAKVRQMVGYVNSLPCHTVVIMHSTIDKNELTGAIIETPSIYGKTRDTIGNLFSQFFYATKQGTKPIIWTTDQGFVRGIGGRWPAGLPAICAPDFQSIYGKEGLE